MVEAGAVKVEDQSRVQSGQKPQAGPVATAVGAGAGGQVAVANKNYKRQKPNNKRSQPDSAPATQDGTKVFKRPQLVFDATAPIVLLRLVCPQERIGSVIGKGGDVIKMIREETGARVRVEDMASPGAKERIITISSDDMPGAQVCSAQDALMRVIARMIEADMPNTGVVIPDIVELIINIPHTYAGAVIGKSGANINDIKTRSGAFVLVLPIANKHELAAEDEDTVKINGNYEAVRRAVHLTSERMRTACHERKVRAGLLDPAPTAAPSRAPNPAFQRPGGGGPPPFSAPPLFMGPPGGGGPPPGFGPPMGMLVPHGPRLAGAGPPLGPGMSQGLPNNAAAETLGPVQTQYRFLIPNDRAGSMIGKGGETLKRFREESGCTQIKVHGSVAATTERVLECVSSEHASAPACHAAEGFMACASHLVKNASAPIPGVLRILLPADQVVVAVTNQRQLSLERNLVISVKPPSETPACGAPGDQVLQLQGSVDSILRGARALTILLRGHIIRTLLAAKQPLRSAGPAPAPAAAPPAAARPPPVQPMQAAPPAGTTTPHSRRLQSFTHSALCRMSIASTPSTSASRVTAPGMAMLDSHPVKPTHHPKPSTPAYPPPAAAVPPVAAGRTQDVRLSINVSPAMLPTLTNMNNLQQMRQLSGANVFLKEQPTANGEREVEISGTMAQATTAHRLIEQLLQAGAALQQQQQQQPVQAAPTAAAPAATYKQAPPPGSMYSQMAPPPAVALPPTAQQVQQQQAQVQLQQAAQAAQLAAQQQQLAVQQQQLAAQQQQQQQQAAYNQVQQAATAAYNAAQQSAAAAGYSQIHQQTTATAAYNQVTTAAGYSQGLIAPGTATVTASATPLGNSMFDAAQLGVIASNTQYNLSPTFVQSGYQQQQQQQTFNQPQQQSVYQQQYEQQQPQQSIAAQGNVRPLGASVFGVKQQMSGYQ
ncbi:MAG: hypothetical protein WDW38_003113 [Sanguina aurantia]